MLCYANIIIAFVIYQTLLIGQAKKRAQPSLPLHCSQDEVSQFIITYGAFVHVVPGTML